MDIPQEENKSLDGHKKVMYAKDQDGQFITQPYGSQAEEFATLTAVQEYEWLEQEALNNIRQGLSSPIAFYMYKNRMDLTTLSRCVHRWPFIVKRHLKMKYFKKLSDQTLMRYAQIFEIELDELKQIK